MVPQLEVGLVSLFCLSTGRLTALVICKPLQLWLWDPKCRTPLKSRRPCSPPALPDLSSYRLPVLFSTMALESCMGGFYKCLDMAEHSTVIDSLYFNQLWVSMLTTIQCTKKSLGQSLRAALVCWVKDTDLEGSLILCPFSRIIGVSLSLGSVGSIIVTCWKRYSTTFTLLWRGS